MALRQCLKDETDESFEKRLPWLHLLWTAARSFLNAQSDMERENASSLIAYGRRRGQAFLDKSDRTALPMFGLADPLLLASLSNGLASHINIDEEDAITNLRLLAQQCELKNDISVIRYCQKADLHGETHGNAKWEYATAIPTTREMRELDHNGVIQDNVVHTRWIDVKAAESRAQNLKVTGEECERFDHASIMSVNGVNSMKSFLWHLAPEQFLATGTYGFEKLNIAKDFSGKVLGLESNRKTRSAKGIEISRRPALLLEGLVVSDSGDMVDSDSGDMADSDSGDMAEDLAQAPVFDYIAGDPNATALFIIRSKLDPMKKTYMEIFDVAEHLRSGKVNPSRLRKHLESLSQQIAFVSSSADREAERQARKMPDLRSLELLARATHLYRNLHGATIPMAIASQTLHAVSWSNTQSFTRATKFACIALFETGTLDIDPSTLTSVMAMSSGNSIYVADALLQDPLEPNLSIAPGRQGITRILGNLDRPGVVMLVPPQAPLIRAEEPEAWRLVNHSLFNDKIEESFAETSLHLSFTEYEIPLSVPIGAVASEATMLESLISVYDRQRWVADLDILGSLKDEDFFRRLRTPTCNCGNGPGGEQESRIENFATQMGKAVSKRLVAIDNWDELLDPPERLGELNIGVVRGGDNWHARLALMSVSVQKKHRTAVLPMQPLCTVCGSQSIKNMAGFAEILIM